MLGRIFLGLFFFNLSLHIFLHIIVLYCGTVWFMLDLKFSVLSYTQKSDGLKTQLSLLRVRQFVYLIKISWQCCMSSCNHTLWLKQEEVLHEFQPQHDPLTPSLALWRMDFQEKQISARKEKASFRSFYVDRN